MMDNKHTVLLSIGSNVGEKAENLDTAVKYLDLEDEINVVQVSSYYKTQPQNYTDQDWFVNAAIKIKTHLVPEDLLKRLKHLETRMDKNGKPFRFGPRRIDLDIIFYGDRILKNERLEIPHPRMHERCFVLVPLCDIAADMPHPVLKQTPGELLDKIQEKEGQEVILLDKEA